ncbi:hypothetical protein [Variovorax boronicumulans]|uniref:hypothetical protein n=1 Tax=Variovorax boronicumulans TaxID=436515 RepID=UPI0012E611CB|nr:hypothetical protein [Variovorax boronicumulans]GER16714.1 hypothetical protein VCH24_17210 [Variovorax boronicumulans]
MTTQPYGAAPVEIGHFKLRKPELLFVQYMPIKLAGSSRWAVPSNLQPFAPLMEHVDCQKDDYVYVTARHLFVGAGAIPNRPGWHADGFGTSDVNYIWADSIPTEFCVQPFALSDDHSISMAQMEKQARPENFRTYPDETLLRLDASVIHRPAVAKVSGFRVFVKFSVSRDRYDLEGNAHNPLLDYDWPLHARAVARNNPSAQQHMELAE